MRKVADRIQKDLPEGDVVSFKKLKRWYNTLTKEQKHEISAARPY